MTTSVKTCTACRESLPLESFEHGKRQCRQCRWQIRKAKEEAAKVESRRERMRKFNALVNWPAPQ